MGTEPAGWMFGSAEAGATEPPATVVPITISDAASAVESLPMTDQRNRSAEAHAGVLKPGCSSRGVESAFMLSLPEISDRLEIQQLLVDYASAIDQRRFDDLDRVFTPDAYIDYRAMGGIDGQYPQVKAWLAEVLPHFGAYYHLVGNFDLRLAGDTASGRTMCFNPMQLNKDGQVLFCALWYEDDFIRTPTGWRIARRVEAKCLDKLV